MLIGVGIAVCIILVSTLLYIILKSPFSYPYFVYKFDVSGKRGPQIEDFLDEIFCKTPQNLVEQRITPHFLTANHPNYYEFTTKG